MTDATRTLAAYAAGLRLETVPPPVVARAERLILDFAGCVARGGAEADSSPVLRRVLVTAGLDGDGPCRVIGDARGHGPAAAAFLTAAFGHALDFDDTHAAASLHPSAPVVSAALAAAGASPVRGADLVAGIIAGYEVTCRLGLALDPTQLYARGFHPTAIAGIFGAAAAAGRVLGLSPEAMVCAFGIAGSAAAGSMQFIVNGAWTKRFQVGACAKNGLLAALFAADGFSGSVAAIEGVHGLLKGYSDGADPERAVRGLGTDYETLRIGLKPYPNCRYIHAPLAGLAALRAHHGLRAQDIIGVRIGMHPNGIALTGTPIAEKRRPRTVIDGQFSMPFTAAVMLDQGSFRWEDHARLGEPALDALCDRIDVVPDSRVENRPHPFGATLRIETRSGIIEAFVSDPPWDPDSFPDDGALTAKFSALAGPVLGADETHRLAGTILSLSRAPVARLA
ncbi:MAG: 2-methylcitrate dehydratase [Rhizobiales bacterium 35-68-8]|nr:MAG: 2-methylcitrate dehydratase [Rhizobiales bacterium 35-68-8]